MAGTVGVTVERETFSDPQGPLCWASHGFLCGEE